LFDIPDSSRKAKLSGRLERNIRMMDPLEDGSNREVEAVVDLLRKRAPLLELLADGARDQRDLRDELGVSRSTVYKSLQQLRDAGLVAERDGVYALTGFGRLAWQRHDDYLARLRRLDAGRRLLETLPADQQFPPTLFERGRITVPGRHAPERPLDRLSELGGKADHLRVLSPSGMPRFLASIHENVEAGKQTAQIVVESDAIPRLRSGYDRFDTAVGAEGFELRVISNELPYALVLFDEADVGLFGYEEGVLVGAAFSDDPDALSWGERIFQRTVERSKKI
jgi:predicted transcriptional regulator